MAAGADCIITRDPVFGAAGAMDAGTMPGRGGGCWRCGPMRS